MSFYERYLDEKARSQGKICSSAPIGEHGEGGYIVRNHITGKEEYAGSHALAYRKVRMAESAYYYAHNM